MFDELRDYHLQSTALLDELPAEQRHNSGVKGVGFRPRGFWLWNVQPCSRHVGIIVSSWVKNGRGDSNL